MKNKEVVKVSVVVVGLPCAGKTAVGQALSRVLGKRWVDTDSLIEDKAKRSVTEIFRVEGEERFRALEHEVLQDVTKDCEIVVSLGGGALTREDNLRLLKDKSVLIWLIASTEELAKRAYLDEQTNQKEKQQSKRPLLVQNGDNLPAIEAAISKLAFKRQQSFENAKIRVWTEWSNPQVVAAAVKSELSLVGNSENNPVVVMPVGSESLAGFESDVVIDSNLLTKLAERIESKFPKAEKIALVTDENVDAAWGENVRTALNCGQSNKRQWTVEVYKLPSGEQSKNLSLVAEVAERMLKDEFSRTDVVVGLGGGVVGDFSGLLASLYMRGIGLVHLPTTIVAQVDSAIGGKTGVNLKSGKNSLGTFYPARLVLSNQSFLSTLAEREFVEGLAEVVKYGLIASEDFFVWLETNVQKILKRDPECLRRILEVSSEIKLRHVVGDLADTKGRRALLNFGHTLGHAIERLTEYGRFLHGEAIAIGISFALTVGEDLGVTEKGLKARADKLLKSLGLSIELPEDLRADAKVVLDIFKSFGTDKAISDWEKKLENTFFTRWVMALKADKKRASSAVQFILVGKLGSAEVREIEVFELTRHLASFAGSH